MHANYIMGILICKIFTGLPHLSPMQITFVRGLMSFPMMIDKYRTDAGPQNLMILWDWQGLFIPMRRNMG